MRMLLVLFILSFCFQVLAQTSCPVRNHIFLIHGIGGNAKTFGQMDRYLKSQDECYEVYSFEYDTGNSSLSTYDFAESFQQYLCAKAIPPQDKISLIMHSQGGLVGNIWLNAVRERNPFLYQQVDAFITLSTPHWGAEIANIGKHLFFTMPESMKNPISPFGRIELNEMSYGSATIAFLNSVLTQNFRPLNFRPLAVGGIHKIKNSVIGENDVVVPLYSSRPDHFFANSDININDNSGGISVEAFTKTNRMPFVTVPATHLKLDLPGIASIPEKCLTGCDHPALPVIMDHLKGRSIASTTEKLDHFRASLYLNNTTGDKIDKDDVKIDILSKDNISIPVSNWLKQYKGEAKLTDGMAFSIQGHTKQAGVQRIRLLLKIKNKLTREIEIPVEGGFSSVVQLRLK